MPQPQDVLPLLQQMLVNIPAEDDLLFHCDARVEIDLQLASALGPARQLDAQLFPGDAF